MIALNKVSDAGRERVVEALRIIHTLNPTTRVIEAGNSNVSLSSVLGTGLFDSKQAR